MRFQILVMLLPCLVRGFPFTNTVSIISARHRHGKTSFTFLAASSSLPSDLASSSSQADAMRKLAHDFDLLSQIRSPDPATDTSIRPALVSAGSSYTRLWTAQTWNKHSSPPHRRYARHIMRWPASTTARIILPTVLVATVWSLLCSLACKLYDPIGKVIAQSGASSSVSYLSAPLALLLTLRANASMSRLLEARLVWGRLVLQTRALANIIKTYVYPQCPNASISVIRHLAVMGWVLKSFVRGKDTDWEVVKIMLDGTDSQDYQWMTSQTKPTVALTARVRQICGVALGNMSGLSPCVAGGILLVIEERIRELENIVGACQRLFSSPIPPTYSRHLSRVISLWIFFLPVSLIAAALPPLGVTLATTCAAYVIIGIDEVGMEIENSFQLLPLQQLCWAVQTDVREAFFADMPEVEV